MQLSTPCKYRYCCLFIAPYLQRTYRDKQKCHLLGKADVLNQSLCRGAWGISQKNHNSQCKINYPNLYASLPVRCCLNTKLAKNTAKPLFLARDLFLSLELDQAANKKGIVSVFTQLLRLHRGFDLESHLMACDVRWVALIDHPSGLYISLCRLGKKSASTNQCKTALSGRARALPTLKKRYSCICRHNAGEIAGSWAAFPV